MSQSSVSLFSVPFKTNSNDPFLTCLLATHFGSDPFLATHGSLTQLNSVQAYNISDNPLLPFIFLVTTFEHCHLLGFAFSAPLGETSTYAALQVGMFGRYKGGHAR